MIIYRTNTVVNTLLTKRQKEILDFVTRYAHDNGYAPTLEEIAEEFGLKSIGTVAEHLENLQKKGYLKRIKGESRAITPYGTNERSNTTEIPLMGLIPAGGPIEPIRNPEPLEVPRSMLSKSGRHYALKVEGSSMVEDGIFDNDIIVVREQPIVENGQNAVAYLPDSNEVTLKKIYKEKGRFRLQPANAKMKPIYVENVEVQGRVVGVLRKIR